MILMLDLESQNLKLGIRNQVKCKTATRSECVLLSHDSHTTRHRADDCLPDRYISQLQNSEALATFKHVMQF